MIRWSSNDRYKSFIDGWYLWNSAICATVKGPFKTDAEALAHVEEKAKLGSALHKRGLKCRAEPYWVT